MIRSWRALLAITHDAVACFLAWLAAHWLRFNLDVPEHFLGLALHSAAWVVPINVAIFWMFSLYRGLWRYASLPDLKRIIAAVFVASITVPTVLFMLNTPISDGA